MRPGAFLEVAELPGGGVRVDARDWPHAVWLAVPCLLAGLPLVLWSLVEGHAVELGGGAVFTGMGLFCVWLARSKCRSVELRATAAGAHFVADEGARPWRRRDARALGGPVDVTVADFATPEGAPDLPDRGADLVLTAEGFRYVLVRAAGGRARTLPALRARILAALAPDVRPAS